MVDALVGASPVFGAPSLPRTWASTRGAVARFAIVDEGGERGHDDVRVGVVEPGDRSSPFGGAEGHRNDPMEG